MFFFKLLKYNGYNIFPFCTLKYCILRMYIMQGTKSFKVHYEFVVKAEYFNTRSVCFVLFPLDRHAIFPRDFVAYVQFHLRRGGLPGASITGSK